MENIDELEQFLLKHGENIVDMLGGEIDRIELKLKVNAVNLSKLQQNGQVLKNLKYQKESTTKLKFNAKSWKNMLLNN